MSRMIHWKRTPGQIAGRIFDRETMIYAHTRLKQYCDDYVPAHEYNLRDSGTPLPEYLLYPGPYAHYQWMGDVYGPNIPVYKDGVFEGFISPPTKHPTGKKLNYSKDKNPKATSHWEEAAMAVHKDDLIRDIEDYLKRK